MVGPGRLVVGHIGLCADVGRHMGRIFLAQGQRPQVRQDSGVGPHPFQSLQKGGQPLHFFVAGHGIHCDEHPLAPGVGVFHRPLQLFFSKVIRSGAHAEIFACQVHGVGPIGQGIAQPFKVARRRKAVLVSSHPLPR